MPEETPIEDVEHSAKALQEEAEKQALLGVLEQISLHIRKQDGQNLDLIKLLQKMDEEFPDLTATLKQLAETQPEILERLDKIEKNNRPKSLGYKFTVGAAKFPLQVLGGVFKTIGIVAIPPILAASIYVGNGNDPMDIPQNLIDWAEKHNIIEQFNELTGARPLNFENPNPQPSFIEPN